MSLIASGDSLVVFRDGSFADGRSFFVNQPGSAACFDAATLEAIDCAPLEKEKREALERLTVSDLVIYSDLIPSLELAEALPQPSS